VKGVVFMLGFFFQFKEGRNIFIKSDNIYAAMKEIEDNWYAGIFNEQDFTVTKVQMGKF
jgi:hypothetical protein